MRPTPLERLLTKIDRTPGGDACWPWLASRTKNGYGKFYLGQVMHAHRAAYLLLVGPIPAGLHIDHLCHNRLCVNPQHLEAVTPAENSRRTLAALAVTCSRGHRFTPENTYHPPQSPDRRYCRKCAATRARGYKADRRPERGAWERLHDTRVATLWACAEAGEGTPEAAAKLGMTFSALAEWCRKHDRDVFHALRAVDRNDPEVWERLVENGRRRRGLVA